MPTMSKKVLILLLILSTLAVAAVACASSTSGTSSQAGSTTTGNTVHMGDMNFLQSSVTIRKGEKLTLTDDSAVTHIIANGSWDGSTPKSASEQGAPEVKNVNISGTTSQTLGPFTTAGTFHLYCTIHPGMNLTVIVQ